MDSCTLLTEAVSLFGRSNVFAVGFNYGQKHAVELKAAEDVAEHFGVLYTRIDLPRIFAGAGSTLVDADAPIEDIGLGSYQELAARHGAQPTVVPNRNMNFIAMAVTYALTVDAGKVYVAVHGDDAHNYHYPDCRPEFIDAMTEAIHVATSGKVFLEAPYVHISKADIVMRAAVVNAPLALTHSCYKGEQPACGKCATCVERIEAFRTAGYIDPIPYAEEIPWPTGANPGFLKSSPRNGAAYR
jgi:7-cyano-7-deazaguanine synthase